MTDNFKEFMRYTLSVDRDEKNKELNEFLTKNGIVITQYDMDTTMHLQNFSPGKYAINAGKNEYAGYIYDDIIKYPEDGYYTYDFILVNNGKVIAMGDEQGRCGGIISTCESPNFAERIKRSPAYEKVKHLPIATPEELEKPIYKHFNSYEEYQDFLKENQP